MKLLFFAMSTAGYGETTIGMSLAEQLQAIGIESHFVSTVISEQLLRRSKIPYTVLDQRMGRLARLLIDEVVTEFKPDGIVLSDYYTYTGVFEHRFGLDPWFIDEYQLPILPIDIWEWDKTSFAVDMFGEERTVDKRILAMEASLRPVPLAHPGRRDRAYPFRLWPSSERVSRRTKQHLFTTFGLGPRDRLVLITIAHWQQLAAERYISPIGTQVLRGVPWLLAHYLRQLPDSTHFAIIGQVPPELAALPAGRTHALPSCSPTRFSTLLGASDLVLGLNVGASTLGRAVLSDIPAVVLTNSYAIPDARAVAEAEAGLDGLTDTVRDWLAGIVPLHRMRMWPLGFYSFLEPILSANPYTSTYTDLELLDEPAAVRGIEQALYDSQTRNRLAAARADYLATVDDQVDTPASFAAAASRLGLNGQG